MKKIVKILSLVLALLMLASAFAACGKKDDEEKKPNDDTSAQTSGGDNTTGDVTTKVPDIEKIDWDDKEYRVLGKTHTSEPSIENFEVSREGEEIPEDIIGKSVWNRNMDIKDNYGIIVKGTLTTDYNAKAALALESGEDLYELLLLSPESFLPHAQKGYLLDLMKQKYINLAHDAWMDSINDQLIIGGRLYYTSNKFLLQDKIRAYILYYNRDIAKELNLGHFEDFVFNNEWTIDKVIELAKQATYEEDGEPGMSKYDKWGIGVAENYSFSQFALGAGFRMIERGPDGYLQLIGATDEMMKILDKVFSLVRNQEAYYCDQHYGTPDYSYCADQMFYYGDLMIFGGGLCMVDYITEVAEFEFGFLPNPKYDSKQELYHATPNLGNGCLMGIPTTVSDSEFATYALELISEKSVNTTYTAFVETKCKLQDAVDEDAAKCLDLIFNGMVYDLGFVNNIAGLGKVVTSSLASSPTNNYPRLLQRLESTIPIMLNNIKEDFQKIEQ